MKALTKATKTLITDFLNSYKIKRFEVKEAIFKERKDQILLAEKADGVALVIFKEIFGDDVKTGIPSYSKEVIDAVFSSKVIADHFEKVSTSRYVLKSYKGWVEFKKSNYCTPEQAEKCSSVKGFSSRYHDPRYSQLAGIVKEIREEQLPKDENKKTDLAQEIERFKKIALNKFNAEEDKTTAVSEINGLIEYLKSFSISL